MTTEATVGGFAADPKEAFNPPAAGSCCGSAPAATDSPAEGGCCGTDAAVSAGSCCGSTAVAEPASAAVGGGCCG
jgi:hypothetical protein